MHKELSIKEALQLGIKAHKSGDFKLAARYYSAILKVQSEHSHANHNMGVLAIERGNTEEAVSFFQRALEADKSVDQFWISYIKTLIDQEKPNKAEEIITKAKRNGVKLQSLHALEKELIGYRKSDDYLLKNVKPHKDKMQNLLEICNSGQLEHALIQSKHLVKRYPNSSTLYNICGIVNAALKNYEDAIDSYKRALAIKPDDNQTHYNIGLTFEEQGRYEEAITSYKNAISSKPDFAEAYNNLGNAFQKQGKLENAINAYKKVLYLTPHYPEVFNNIGLTLQKQGKLAEARSAYNKALSIKPEFAEAHNNMGIVQQIEGTLDQAILSYEAAINFKPDFAEAYNNLGNIYKEQGKYDMAIDVYQRVISLKPNFAEAHNNMGLVLYEKGKLKEAIQYYKRALSNRPSFADAAWNLYGTATNVSEATKWLEYCLSQKPDHLKAQLSLCALQFYQGDHSHYFSLMGTSLSSHPYMRSFSWVFNLNKLPKLFFNRWAFFDYTITISKRLRPFYEFGVWRGDSFSYLMSSFKEGFGFDTFEGLPEDWYEKKAGSYTSDGDIPQIKDAKFIVGKFEDTLQTFFSKPRSKAALINFDADLYSSTLCALNFSKAVIDEDTVLIFDEFIINENWEQDEFKAFNEFCNQNGYNYEVLAISFFTKQVATRLVKIEHSVFKD